MTVLPVWLAAYLAVGCLLVLAGLLCDRGAHAPWPAAVQVIVALIAAALWPLCLALAVRQVLRS